MSTATETAIVTKNELIEIAEWERKFADAQKKASAAEKELKFRRIALAEKVLGVKSADDLKKLSPKQIERLKSKRLTTGDWKPERGAPEFSFSLTSKGSYPAWMQIYVKEFGESEAEKIKAETPLVYSYAVEVSAV